MSWGVAVDDILLRTRFVVDSWLNHCRVAGTYYGRRLSSRTSKGKSISSGHLVGIVSYYLDRA
jgi:hypothetical protein